MVENKENLNADSGHLEIKNVTQIFGDGPDQVIALNDFSLDVQPGEFISFIGPSGCGKSTLLRIISALDKPVSGYITLDGKEIVKPGKDIGMAFQQSNLFQWLSVEENIAFGLKARGEYKENRKDVQDIIEVIGLNGFNRSFPYQISGGMAQRASLARSLVGHPKVLLLDEPLGALDAFTRMSMQDEILRLWEKYRMTVLMVTHDVDEAIYLSDKVVVMSPRPAKVEKIIEIKKSRPRARSQDDFLLYRSEILKILHFGGEVHEPEYTL